MEARKLAIISGIYSNTNYDDGKQTRQKAISEIEENFREAITNLYNPQEEDDSLKDNPFFEAINVPGGDVDWEEYAKHNPPVNAPPIAQVIPDDDIDQGF